MTTRRTRRLFLTDLGRTTAGLVVLGGGLAACTGEDPGPGAASGGEGAQTTPPAAGAPTTAPPTTEESPAVEESPTADAEADSGAAGATTPHIVELGFVSAYVLVRDGEATLVDTGVPGSEGDVLAVLEAQGLGWDMVSNIVVTHSHGDHAGSLPTIADLAAGAAIHAGEADIPAMGASRTIAPVGDGDVVFGLQIISSPGHTPGHISVYDPAARFLVTGDALVGDGSGGLAGPPAEFTADMGTAVQSVAKLAGLDVTDVLVSHGYPAMADTADLRALAEQLTS